MAGTGSTATLIAALWDHGDAAGSEARFVAALRSRDLDEDGHVEVTTQVARAMVLQERSEEALALLRDVGDGIDERGLRARIRWQLESGRALASAMHGNDPAGALIHYETAWRLADQDQGADDLAVDAAHMASIVNLDPSGKARWLALALERASASSEPHAQRWRASLLNNLGMLQHQGGDDAAALASFREALACRFADGAAAGDIFVAEWMVAWALRLTGEHEAALAILWRLEAAARERNDPDPYVFEELGQHLLEQGRDDEAAVWLGRAGRT